MAAGAVPLVGYVRVSSIAGRRDERFQSPELQREVIVARSCLNLARSISAEKGPWPLTILPFRAHA